MTRLIDVDAAIGGVKNRCLGQNDVVKVEHSIISMLYMMPTIDAEPVRHGKWIDRTIKVSAELTNIIHVCSVCEEMAVGKYRYCPHCGARMDKDDQVN